MRIFAFTALSLLLLSCQTGRPGNASESGDHLYTNGLINSSSPYLLQHAHNPVDWHPWGPEALQKARDEGKMLIISVGYAACHWCHVMEHESFEDTAVARLMNAHFVPIKVDREERPDVDQVYMNAAYLTTGRGGWPLNAIALPDGRPFFAGTYFPKDKWVNVLERFVDLYAKEPGRIEEVADQITVGIQRMDLVPPLKEDRPIELASVSKIAENLKTQIDPKLGGLQGAPKFPMPGIHRFLLHYQHAQEDAKALELVQTTLDQMAAGGIYDQLGGGFARYSTDQDWLVPHFEKMLYDNAQLVSLYAEAYQATQKKRYKEVIEASLQFVARELRGPEGEFYSSLDADSEGEEGLFYVWTQTEIEALLGEDATAFNAQYGVRKNGNWEGKNVLHYTPGQEPDASLDAARETLFAARAERVRPGLDDKALAAWNALMLTGYLDAYDALGEPAYLQTALENAAFIEKQLTRPNGRLRRSYRAGQADIDAFADDYAFVIRAWVRLYQLTFDESWLNKADRLMAIVLEQYFDEQTETFFYTSKDAPALISRSRELADNVIPGANSVLADDLFVLGTYLQKDEYLQKASRMSQKMLPQSMENSPYYHQWATTMLYQAQPPYEVAIVGPDAAALRAEMAQHFLPNVLWSGSTGPSKLPLLEHKFAEGVTRIFVCQDRVCKFPVETVEEALAQIK